MSDVAKTNKDKPKKTTDDIVDVSGESSIRRFLEEWEQNRQDDTFVPSNGAQARLIAAMADELMQRSDNLTPASCVTFAGYLVARAVKEGWVHDE